MKNDVKVLLLVSIAVMQTTAFAQTGRGTEQLNQFFRGIEGSPQPRPAGPVAQLIQNRGPRQSPGFAYTPEQLESLIDGARQARTHRGEYQPSQLCDRAAFDRFPGVMGLTEMKKECTARLTREIEEERERNAAVANAQRAVKANEAAAKQQEEAEKEKTRETALVADLRAGRRKPENCGQWAISKGQGADSYAAPVTQVALQPPSGAGPFVGRVEQIEGRTLLLSDQPIIKIRGAEQGYLVTNLDAASTVISGEVIRVGTVVAGYATQHSTRSIRKTDGSAVQAPVLSVLCIHPLR